MHTQSYLVTGGTGFIGSALVQRLVQKGHRVRVIDNGWRGRSRRLKPVMKDIEMIKADIRDAKAVAKAAKGMDSIFHLAFINGTEFFYTKPDLVLEVAVKGMINVLDAAIQHGVKELFLASSSEVYQTPAAIPTDESVALCIPDPLNPRYSYGAGKIISEMMALNYGRKHFERVLIFRPHNVYGADMGCKHVLPQLTLRMKGLVQKSSKANEVLRLMIQGTGKETRAFIYIDDFVDAVMFLAQKGTHLGIYHIGTMEEISIKEVAHKIARYFQRRIEIVSSEPAKGGTPRRCPDTRKITVLGFRPRYSFDEGLHLLIKWYDAHASGSRASP